MTAGVTGLNLRIAVLCSDVEEDQKLNVSWPEIVEFSELGDAIEKPFNTYSSGMMTRLAFSVSTMIEPDILLLDEWIGAADAHFNKKVKTRMDKLVEQSRGLVLASHNEVLMRNLCTHGLVLSKGKAIFYGKLEEALDVYDKLTCLQGNCAMPET